MSRTQRLADAEILLVFHQHLSYVEVSGEDCHNYLRTHPIDYVPTSDAKNAYLAFFHGCRMDTYKCFLDTYSERGQKIISHIKAITAEIVENA